VFGFVAWEFKENWNFFAGYRPRKLQPALVGSHGETLLRLLTPGFHSGTIPRIYAKRRRNARKSRLRPSRDRQAKFNEQLHHVAEEVRQFIERDLITLLRYSRAFKSAPLSLANVKLATNRITLEIRHADFDSPLVLRIAEQSGWLIAGVLQTGWADRLDERQRRVLHAALAGVYKLGAVGLVREQIESRFVDPKVAYDISASGLVVWPLRDFRREITYSLDERPTSVPRPRSAARAAGLAPMPLSDIVFREHELEWKTWESYWEAEQKSSTIGEIVEIRLLPLTSAANGEPPGYPIA
jgi:hypothetical protein